MKRYLQRGDCFCALTETNSAYPNRPLRMSTATHDRYKHINTCNRPSGTRHQQNMSPRCRATNKCIIPFEIRLADHEKRNESSRPPWTTTNAHKRFLGRSFGSIACTRWTKSKYTMCTACRRLVALLLVKHYPLGMPKLTLKCNRRKVTADAKVKAKDTNKFKA